MDEGRPTWAKVFALGDEERLPGRALTPCECRGLGLIDHMVKSMLNFEETTQLSSRAAALLAFLPATNASSRYSAPILPALGGVSVLDFSHSARCVVGSHYFQSVFSLICICHYYARAHRQCTQGMWAEFKTEQ